MSIDHTAAVTSAPTAARARRRTSSRIRAGVLYGLVILLVLAAVVGPLLVQDPTVQHLRVVMKPPFWQAGSVPGHLLGTDALGRDVLARTLVGLRSSLSVCGLALMIAFAIGVPLGMVSGATWAAPLTRSSCGWSTFSWPSRPCCSS